MLTVIIILQLIAALFLILVVLFQSGKSQGLSGTIGGIADSYMAKSKAKSLDAKLAKGTKWVGGVFIVLTVVIHCMLAAAGYRNCSEGPGASLRGAFYFARRYVSPACGAMPLISSSSATVTNT